MEEPSPAVQYSLRVSACRQRLHEYTLGNLFLAVAAAAPCSPVQFLVPISPVEMLSTVTPSSPIRTPTLRKNVQTTCLLASRSSIAVAPSICIYQVQPPSERASSLAVIQVHSRGIPDGLPGPLPPLPPTLGLQSQKSNALQVDAMIPGLVPRQFLPLQLTVYSPRLPPCVRISSLSKSHSCHIPLGLSDNQILSIPTWGYDTSIEPLCAF